MKRNYIKLMIIEIIMLLIICFNTFISSIFTSSNLYYILFWIFTFIVLVLSIGFKKDKQLYKIDILQIIFIYSMIYLLATYIFGFFFGFVKSPYSLSFIKIIQNILPVFIIMVFQELVRYNIINKGRNNKVVICLLIVVFTLLDISVGLKYYIISDAMSIFEMIGLLILPSIAKNLLFTYISYKNGYTPVILYRILFELTVFILPIFPDLGIYFESILNIVFPIALFLKLNTFFAKVKPTSMRVSKMSKFLFWTPTITILVTIVILVSGIFKIYVMAIASPSMVPSINKGDAIIVEKLNDKEIEELKIGDVIAYEYDKKIVVHRIVKIEQKLNKYYFQTKGDNNNDADGYEIAEEQLKGIVRYKIPFIGYPSVWLSELVN